MDHLIEAAKDEERRLLAKLNAIRTLLNAYEHVEDSSRKHSNVEATSGNTASLTASIRTNSKVRVGKGFRKPDSLTSRAEAAAIAYLETKGSRAQSQEILEAISDQGINFAMKNPVATLSSILSNSHQFDNVRGVGRGYGLARWRTEGIPATADKGQRTVAHERIVTLDARRHESSGPRDHDEVAIDEVGPTTPL